MQRSDPSAGTMQPRPVDRQMLWSLFKKVDSDNNGQINAKELQSALSNGLRLPFNLNVVVLMIKLFDRDYSGCIEFNEFTSLFSYIEQWKTCFQRFDRDNSGAIDASEFKCALQTFRYNLSDSFIQQMVRRFDRTRTGQVAFDDFIHACVCLQLLTAAFRPLDQSGNGWAQMSFEQFLLAAFEIV